MPSFVLGPCDAGWCAGEGCGGQGAGAACSGLRPGDGPGSALLPASRASARGHVSGAHARIRHKGAAQDATLAFSRMLVSTKPYEITQARDAGAFVLGVGLANTGASGCSAREPPFGFSCLGRSGTAPTAALPSIEPRLVVLVGIELLLLVLVVRGVSNGRGVSDCREPPGAAIAHVSRASTERPLHVSGNSDTASLIFSRVDSQSIAVLQTAHVVLYLHVASFIVLVGHSVCGLTQHGYCDSTQE